MEKALGKLRDHILTFRIRPGVPLFLGEKNRTCLDFYRGFIISLGKSQPLLALKLDYSFSHNGPDTSIFFYIFAGERDKAVPRKHSPRVYFIHKWRK